jgi:hypothetical protein
MRKDILQIISTIKSDWKWICLGYEGIVPQKITPDQLFHFSSVLNIPTEDFLMNNSFNSKSQLNPEFWKTIHEHPKFIIRFKTPKVITRRVCLIEVNVQLNEFEKDYIEFLKKFRYRDILSILLGSNIEVISGSKTSIVLERKGVMTIEEALQNCEEHFKDGGGTYAQKMQLKFYEMISQTSDKNYVKQILNNPEKICQICREENEEIKEEFSAQGLREAKERLNVLKLTDTEKAEYDNFINEWRNFNSLTVSNYVAGKLEGIEEGKQQGLELGLQQGIIKEKEATVRKCLQMSMSINDIVNITGLSHQQVESLSK